jgi:DNA invertase Pin-like site-specific DNA recombinase
MVQTGKYTKNKGGRPKKEEKRDQVISIKCSLRERTAIEDRAKIVGLTVSEYLREAGLTGKIDGSKKVLPKATVWTYF